MVFCVQWVDVCPQAKAFYFGMGLQQDAIPKPVKRDIVAMHCFCQHGYYAAIPQ